MAGFELWFNDFKGIRSIEVEMVRKVSGKVKLVALLLIGSVVSGVVYVYQKIFGGVVQTMPEGETVTGRSEDFDVVKNKSEEVVAVATADNPALGVREVVGRTGGMDFIQDGQRVLIKPNVNSDDPAPGTTHPEALAEVVRLAKDRGAYVIVGDRSNPRWGTIAAMKATGMYQAAVEAGADEIVGFEDGEWIRVKPEKAEHWPKGFRVPAILSSVDHIISVPVLHTHSITSHSLALKNLVGLIHPADRMLFHASGSRDEMIAEISLAISPTLTVIDGTRSFVDGGPSTGTISESKIYLASKDVLVADVVGVELLKRDGAKLSWDDPWESGQIKRALELGVGKLGKREIQEELRKLD